MYKSMDLLLLFFMLLNESLFKTVMIQAKKRV